MRALLAVFLAAPGPLAAQEVVRSERATIEVLEPVKGTVMASENFVLPSPYTGRVEALPVPVQTSFAAKAELALISPPEVAALIDSNVTTDRDILAERWRKVFKLQKVRAPWAGYLLEAKAGLKSRVVEDQPLFVLTRDLVFEALLPMARLPGVKKGMPVHLWKPSDPRTRYRAEVRDILPATPSAADATIRARLVPEAGVPMPFPGTLLDGTITTAMRKGVVTVPSRSLRRELGRSFVCTEVEEGLTDGVRTEVVSGLAAGTVIYTP